MIENNIWQTYETPIGELPEDAVRCTRSWYKINRRWNYHYMSGQDRENFFKEYFDGEVYDTYMKMPMGVMKAGLWRFAILYIHGGIYADLDTMCIDPIEHWLDQEHDMVLDIEGDTPWYATQVIAARKGHPFLKNAIDLCVERMKLEDWTIPNMVHYYTDVAMFTDSLFESLGVEDGYSEPLKTATLRYNELPKAKENKFYSFGGKNARILLEKHVRHLYWGDARIDNYVAWKIDPMVNESYREGFNVEDWTK